MKTRSSSPNLIWTLTDLLCFNPVGDHREESDCQQTQGGLDTSWLWGWTQRPPYWALAQTQSEGKDGSTGKHCQRVLVLSRFYQMDIFWMECVSAKSEPAKADGQKHTMTQRRRDRRESKGYENETASWSTPPEKPRCKGEPHDMTSANRPHCRITSLTTFAEQSRRKQTKDCHCGFAEREFDQNVILLLVYPFSWDK